MTLLSLAVEKRSSLHTTASVSVIDRLGLKKGDLVKWDFGKVDGERIATVRKRVE